MSEGRADQAGAAEPAIRVLSGYRAVYWLMDRQRGKAVQESDVRSEQLRALSATVGFTVESVVRYEVAAQG